MNKFISVRAVLSAPPLWLGADERKRAVRLGLKSRG